MECVRCVWIQLFAVKDAAVEWGRQTRREAQKNKYTKEDDKKIPISADKAIAKLTELLLLDWKKVSWAQGNSYSMHISISIYSPSICVQILSKRHGDFLIRKKIILFKVDGGKIRIFSLKIVKFY